MNIGLSLKKYFHSQYELLDMREKDKRDINTLSTYLTQIHSLADKLRNNYNINLSVYPEFRVLRVLRNYMHHVDDVEELRMYAVLQPQVSLYHMEHLIIPINFWAKCLKNLIDVNTRQGKQKFLNKELSGIQEISDSSDIIENLENFCSPVFLKCDDEVIELGFDIYKFVYNMSNIIVDEFRKHSDLQHELLDIDIDDSYSIENNIPKYDLSSHAGVNCILTLNGYIFPTTVELAI